MVWFNQSSEEMEFHSNSCDYYTDGARVKWILACIVQENGINGNILNLQKSTNSRDYQLVVLLID